MGRISSSNKSLLITLLIAAIFVFSPFHISLENPSKLTVDDQLSLMSVEENEEIGNTFADLDWNYHTEGTVVSLKSSSDGNKIAMITNDLGSMGMLHFLENGQFKWNYTISWIGSEIKCFTSLSISSDGNYIFAGSDDSKMYLFHKNSANPIWISESTEGHIDMVDISNDGSYFVSSSEGNLYVMSFNNSSNQVDIVLNWALDPTENGQYGVFFTSVSISGNGQSIAAGTFSQNPRLYLFDNQGNMKWIHNSPNPIRDIDISYSGEEIVAGLSNGGPGNGGLALFSKNNNSSVWVYDYGTVHSVSISEDGNHIAAGTTSYRNICSTCEYYEIKPSVLYFHKISNIPILNHSSNYQPNGAIRSVDISDDGKYIVARSENRDMLLLSTQSSDVLWNFTYPYDSSVNEINFGLNSVSISQSGHTFIVSSYYEILKFNNNATACVIGYSEQNCGWGDYDTDQDGIINSEDICPEVNITFCGYDQTPFVFASSIELPSGISGMQTSIAAKGGWFKQGCNSYNVMRINLENLPTGSYCQSTSYDAGTADANLYWDQSLDGSLEAFYAYNPYSTGKNIVNVSWGEYLTNGHLPIGLKMANSGNFIVFLNNEEPNTDVPMKLKVWYRTNETPITVQTLGWNNSETLIISNDESSIFVGRYDYNIDPVMHMVEQYDLVTGSIKNTFQCEQNSFVKFHRTERVGCVYSGNFTVHDLTSGSTISIPIGPIDNHRGLALSPDDRLLVYGYDKNVTINNLVNGDIQQFLIESDDNYWSNIRAVGFYKDGTLLYVHSERGISGTPVKQFLYMFGMDFDGDEVIDIWDNCPKTGQGVPVNSLGCSANQVDSDGDGVYDSQDLCSDTVSGVQVDQNGCASNQIDTDEDGISDATDQCPNTPVNETVGLTGCSTSQVDTDSDGVYDRFDNCPYTFENSTVDENGCAHGDQIDLDSDNDGVRDSEDDCETEDGVVVNETGCEAVTENPSSSIDNGLISGGYFTFLCCLSLLLACVIVYTIWYYHDEMKPAYAWIPLVSTIVILIFLTGPIANAIGDDNASFECPDGTIVTYGESKDIRDETGQELSEFIESPPPHWCDGSTAWLDELTTDYIVKLAGVWAGVLFVVCLLLFYIDYKLDITFISVNITTPNIKKTSFFSENFWLGLFLLSLIVMIFLPIAPIESNVESVPGHDWIMQRSCDGESESECWKNDGIDDGSQYRKALGALFLVGLATLIAGAAFAGYIDEWPGMVMGGLCLLTSILGFSMWLWGTIVLGLLEVFAGNPYWITSFSVSILSFGGFLLSPDSSSKSSSSNSSSGGSTPNQVSHPRNNRKYISRSSSKGSTSSNSSYGGKIDHDLIRQLIGQYSDNNDVLTAYQSITYNRTGRVKESKLINAIHHRRSEHNKSSVGSKKQAISQQNSGQKRITYHSLSKSDLRNLLKSELVEIAGSANLSTSGTKAELIERIEISKGWKAQSKPTLASQGSNKSWARESSSMKQQSYKSPSTNPQGSSANQASQPMNMHTDILSSESSKPAQSPIPEFKPDSNGIMTKRTSFSIVTINHVQNRVEKVPTDKSLNPMFLEEIRVMKSLYDKGIDVGLLDYDEGENPKIVTRYFGSHKLGEAIETASSRGKNNLITGLIEQIGKIHKAGWIHRDLKPDNIMVDIRPIDGNHRFDAIIDYGIAMKINRKQTEVHNAAGTKFFGHSSQKDTNFNASTGQDWFSLGRIVALILRGGSIESLNAEIQISQNGLDMEKELTSVGFDTKVAGLLASLIVSATNPQCDTNDAIQTLAKIGRQVVDSL